MSDVKPLQPLVDPDSGQVLVVPRGIFTQDLGKSVEKILNTNIPPGKKAVMLAVVDKSGMHFGVAARLGEDGSFKLAAEASRDWSGDVSGSLFVVKTF